MLVYLEFRNALTQFGEVVGDLVQTAGEEEYRRIAISGIASIV